MSIPMLYGDAADPAGWASAHRSELRAGVLDHGALLVRGLDLRDAAAATAVCRALTDDLMVEREAFAPRQPLGALYSATPWPASQPMCLHHELSYLLDVPGLMAVAGLRAPDSGGAIPVADASEVLAALPADLVQRFEREGWLLVRSYQDEIGASVAEAFGTDDRDAVERYCRDQAVEPVWQPDGSLRTWQRRPAVVRHPVTGVRCWFNQVAFLSRWTLEPDVRDLLVDMYGESGLPFDTRFGNGEPIGEDVIRAITEAYDACTTSVAWQSGDLLLLDNIRTAHGRDPYEGERQVLVALAEPSRPLGQPEVVLS